MHEQLGLDLIDQCADDVPRCRMCARLARPGYTYCGAGSCVNPVRICQACGTEFDALRKGASGHRKYCEECTTRRDQHGNQVPYSRCAWCDALSASRRKSVSGWPVICQECIRPLRFVERRLRDHRVPIDRVRQLRDDPTCEICTTNIVEPVQGSKGRPKPLLVVDHDHTCCSGDRSCGMCVRGLICGTCNTAAGMVRDDPEIAQRLASYLARTGHKPSKLTG